MTITLTPEIATAIAAQAKQQGIPAENLALASLRETFVLKQPLQSGVLREPRSEWERLLRSAASHAEVSLTNDQLSREVMYEDRG